MKININIIDKYKEKILYYFDKIEDEVIKQQAINNFNKQYVSPYTWYVYKNNHDKITDVERAITYGFRWQETKETHEYWAKIAEEVNKQD